MAGDIAISRIICDFVVLVAMAIPLLIFHEFVTPYKRGFYCDDESIRYPYRKSTVSRQMLIVIGILIPTVLILLTEVFRTLTWEKKCANEFRSYRCRQYNIHRLIVRIYVFIGYFFVGVCFNQLMVDIGKYTIGRQRPHFMDVCRPTPGYNTCPNDHLYITEFECQGTNKYLIHEAQLSFYSGHAAFSFYAAWYTTFYLQARLYRPLYSRLVLPLIQFSLFSGAAYVGYTRVSDYKHHWSDVLIGAAMGTAIGIINAIYVAEVFERREIPHRHQGKPKHKLISLEPISHCASDEMIDLEEGSPHNGNANINRHNQPLPPAQPTGGHRNVPIRTTHATEERLPAVMRPQVHEIRR
jgi:phosphatidate phosphatase